MSQPTDRLATSAAPAAPFEPEFIAALTTLFEDTITFNRTLGLRITAVGAAQVTGSIAMRPDLIGHHGHQRLHGGVISATLDAMAGLAVMAAIGARHMDEPPAKRLQRFSRLGTIDMRIDYLRQGIGECFTLSAQVVRLGSRIASTQMQFMGADGTWLATGAATYVL